MSKYRQAAKSDANQEQLVKDLRKLGVSVVTGHDDLICGYPDENGIKRTYWFEVKNPDLVNAQGKIPPSKIKPSQHKLLKEFKGFYMIVWSTEQILEAIGFIKGK